MNETPSTPPQHSPAPIDDRSPRTRMIVMSLVAAAAIVIIFAGIKAAQSIVGPFCLACFLAVILTAPLRWLKSKGFSDMASSLMICVGVLICGVSIIWILSGSVNRFIQRIPEYTEKTNKTLTVIDDYLEPYGLSLQGGPRESKGRSINPFTHFFQDQDDEHSDKTDAANVHGEGEPKAEPESGTEDKPSTERAPDSRDKSGEESGPLAKTADRSPAPFPFIEDPFNPSEPDAIHTVGIVGYIRWGAAELGKLAVLCFIVMILVVFMMFETSRIPKKIVAAFGTGQGITNEHLQTIVDKVWKYIYIKSIISFCVGGLVWLLLIVTGVEYAVLWALVAFLLNFIPNIGSIIAAVPPIALAFFDIGPGTCAVVTVGYLVINQTLGYYVEPIFLGDGLGVSPLVVLLSLIFWGWLLGLIGMFLSAPLTIVIKIILDSFDETRWASILMDDKVDKEPARTFP